MYLSYEQKRKIFNSFLELAEVIFPDGRISYLFEDSNRRKKQIARELSYTGNGYLFGDYLDYSKYPIDPRGWINVRDLNEQDLRALIEKVIQSFI